MKLLRCKFCRGEMDIVSGEHAINKKVKCRQCGYNNEQDSERKMPEVLVIRKRTPISGD
jgi:hypothetical protein